MQEVQAYIDGGCRDNPGLGGWGVVLHGDHERELWGAVPSTTNNQMELTAAIKALEALKNPCHVVIFTDSNYVRQGMTEWLENWKRNGWRTTSKKPVKNQELWEQLDALSQQHEVEWNWVQGHSGNPGNERADRLVNEAMDNFLANQPRCQVP